MVGRAHYQALLDGNVGEATLEMSLKKAHRFPGLFPWQPKVHEMAWKAGGPSVCPDGCCRVTFFFLPSSACWTLKYVPVGVLFGFFTEKQRGEEARSCIGLSQPGLQSGVSSPEGDTRLAGRLDQSQCAWLLSPIAVMC